MNKKILLLDIETAPDIGLLWSLKTNGWIDPKNIVEDGYVLCFAARWLGSKEMIFHKTSDGHIKMLRTIHKLLSKADAAVHYNGKRFDMPTLNKEFIVNGLPPLPPIVQIDLFPLVKRAFKFPSNSLDFVSQKLGLGRKRKTQGREMWYSCMRASHKQYAKAWRIMENYNKGDIVLLERLYRRLRPWFNQTHGYKRIDEWLCGKRQRP